MKKFFLYIFLVLIGTMGVDIVYSLVIEKALSKGLVYSLFGKNELSSDIMIIGSSRAIRHYNPKIMSKKLNSRVQVLGRPSQNIFFHYSMFDIFLKKTKEKPQIVLLELAENDINTNPKESNAKELNVLYPFYYSEPVIREVLTDALDTKELFMVRISGLYRNNSKLFSYVMQILSGKPSSLLLGYSPLNNIWNKPIKEKIEVGIEDLDKTKYLKKFIALCDKEDIQLFFVMSPSYRILRGDNWKNVVKQIAYDYKIPIIDYEQDSTFLSHQEWFYDSYHLNETGANLYSSVVCDELSKISLQLKYW